MRHVTMEQEVTREPLAEAGTTFGFQIHHLGRADDFYVNTVSRGANNRVFHGTVPRCGGQVFEARLPFRGTRPADGATVRMMGMEHLTPP